MSIKSKCTLKKDRDGHIEKNRILLRRHETQKGVELGVVSAVMQILPGRYISQSNSPMPGSDQSELEEVPSRKQVNLRVQSAIGMEMKYLRIIADMSVVLLE